MDVARKPRKQMTDYGFKGVMVHFTEDEYEALRKYCFEKRLKHSPFIRDLVTDKLRKESFLKKETK